MTLALYVLLAVALFAFALLATALLFAGGIFVLGGGAWLWARALQGVYTAHSHALAVAAQSEIVDDSRSALLEAERFKQRRGYDEPTDDDLMRGILAEREYSTTQNERLEDEAIVPPDDMYANREVESDDDV